MGGVPRRDASSVGGSGVGLDLRSGEDGLRHRRPRVARLLRTPCRIPAGVLLPWFLWVRRSGRRLDLPVPFSARSVCVCVCVCLCVCVCGPVSSRVSFRGNPFATGSLASFPRRVDVVPLDHEWDSHSGPFRVHSWGVGPRTCSHLDSWTHPAHSCLSSGESFCSSCGTFSVTTYEQIFFKSVNREVELQLFP